MPTFRLAGMAQRQDHILLVSAVRQWFVQYPK